MAVDLLIVFKVGSNLREIVVSALRATIEGQYNDPPEVEDLMTAIEVRYERTLEQERIVAGLSVETDVLEDDHYAIVEFVRLIGNDEGVLHVLKLGDDSQLAIAHEYLEGIYSLEMKMREALTVIFLDSLDAGYYELLRDSAVIFQFRSRDEVLERMRDYAENEFFYLLFSDYRRVTERKRLGTVGLLIEVIGSVDTLDELKQRLLPSIPLSEAYEDFLASLSAVVEPIEAVRNCVMHNRSVSSTQAQNYDRSYEELSRRLSNFLGSL